ncbi:MAG: hypothetical protein Kow00117_15480 [Phototrophicales bacterium]
MNLSDYARILVRRGWIMVLLALIAGGTAYYFSRQQTPIYRATQVVVLQPSRADLGLAEASVRIINSLVVIINSEQIAAEIIDELQLDMTPSQLKGNVTIASDQLRLTIRIDVNDPNRTVAANVARAWGQKLVEYRDEVNQRALRTDRVEAVMPDLPSVAQIAPRPTFNGIAGALLGLLVGGVIVFILEFIESGVIRTRDELEKEIDLPTLASIPR